MKNAAATLAAVSALCGMTILWGCDGAQAPAQFLVHVATDAPLPRGDGRSSPITDAPALFDTLRIDVFPPGATSACEACSRTISADGSRLEDLSFGVAPDPNTLGYRVELRLFQASTLQGQDPPTGSAITTVIALPVVEPGQRVDITAWLPTDSVGSPIGTLEAPAAPLWGAVAPAHPGEWPGARRIPCTGPPPNGSVCIPGGAYWMGSSEDSVEELPFGFPSNVERLVIVSPFFIDQHEMTVADFRSSGAPPFDSLGGRDPARSTSTQSKIHEFDFCTYTDEPSMQDALPVNCISWAKARQTCQLLGGDLPSEAQFEYAAGALRSERYVWGADAPTCDDAVFERMPTDFVPTPDNVGCFLATGNAGPAPPGSGMRDRLTLDGGEVVDLAGNVSEWMLDEWNRQDEPCWGSGLFRDPVCNQASEVDPTNRSTRGGNWVADSGQVRAARRSDFGANFEPFHSAIGLRCVYGSGAVSN